MVQNGDPPGSHPNPPRNFGVIQKKLGWVNPLVRPKTATLRRAGGVGKMGNPRGPPRSPWIMCTAKGMPFWGWAYAVQKRHSGRRWAQNKLGGVTPTPPGPPQKKTDMLTRVGWSTEGPHRVPQPPQEILERSKNQVGGVNPQRSTLPPKKRPTLTRNGGTTLGRPPRGSQQEYSVGPKKPGWDNL